MGMMQAIRCKSGHHDWGPILGDIDHARHECEQCGKVKTVKATPPRGYGGANGKEGIYYAGGGSGGGWDGGGGDAGGGGDGGSF